MANRRKTSIYDTQAQTQDTRAPLVTPAPASSNAHAIDGKLVAKLKALLPGGERSLNEHFEYALTTIETLRAKVDELSKDLEASKGLLEKFL